MIIAYRHSDMKQRGALMKKLIDDVSVGVPKELVEVTGPGKTLKRRAAGVLAYFDRPGMSNGPTEAINGRFEHLRGTALGAPELGQLHRAFARQGGRV